MTLGILRWHIENASRKSHDSRNITLVYLSPGAVGGLADCDFGIFTGQ